MRNPPRAEQAIALRYNCSVFRRTVFCSLFLLCLLVCSLLPTGSLKSFGPQVEGARAAKVTPFDLIVAMNAARASFGNGPLIEDPIVMAVAQSTAEIMAANQMSSHIGNVDGRIASAGYGGGGKVWATENFAVGNDYSIDEIMVVWADQAHMLPATNPAYCHVGAGIAEAPNGLTYYVLQAAWVAGKTCKRNAPPGGGGDAGAPPAVAVPQIIMPVKIAKPDAEGRVHHVVEAGQSLWAIAIAYKVTIKDLQTWNNLREGASLQIGQRLFIPTSNTKGYATPTPIGMVRLSNPDRDGKIVHTVEAYQTLTTISEAYGVKMDGLLALNGITTDTILSIGQKLLIDPGNVTPSPTPRPLTPIEMLTPAADGKYYHIVLSGQTLSGIAALYDVNLNDLMAWNGLNGTSILQPEQKLLLQVTPPATTTPTPAPATPTSASTEPPAVTPSRPPPTPSPTAVKTILPTQVPPSAAGGMPIIWLLPIALAIGGLILLIAVGRRRQ